MVGRSRALLLGVLVASSLGLSADARADNAMVRLARRLEPLSPGVRHPLANERGAIPFLVELPASEDAGALGLTRITPSLASGALPPAELFSLSDERPDLPFSVTPRLKPLLETGRERIGLDPFVAGLPSGGQGEGVVVGVIDTGIDLTHPAFLHEDGRTRVAWLMTWGPPKGLHPELEEAYGCTVLDTPCAIYSGEDIDELLADEVLRADMHDIAGHGTHVASIAAGNGQRGTEQDPVFIGVAPKATMIVVAPSQGGGFSDSDVIIGSRFIFDRAAELEMPAVVNLSLGGDYGPHDGTSFLEKGTASLVGDDQPGRVIVAAAGNSGALYKVGEAFPLGIHTEVHVDEHAPAEVPIYVPGAQGGDVFVWVTFRPGDEVTVGLDGPDGGLIGQIGPGDEAGYNGEEITAAIVNNLVNDNSSINEDTNSAVVAFYGTWAVDSTFTLKLEGKGDAQLWVTAQGAATQGAYFEQATKQGTIAQPASHPRILGVGCLINRNRWYSIEAGAIVLDALGGGPVDPDLPCYFSGAGPTPLGVPKPEISAPGAFVIGAMGVDADPRGTDEQTMFSGIGCADDEECFVADERYGVASGTSMSAPFVTGAIALMLEQDPGLTQARATEIIQASARKPAQEVPYGSQIGAGALDLTHALEVLAEEGGTGAPAVASESFYFLSAESARPDPSWPVTGTVQLRRADGSIASGLDGSLLAIEVEGGLLVRPATKVTHGLFQFVVAGRRGAGGSEMKVRVSYDGQPIGAVATLPIAVDEWAADGAPTADGGLNCGVADPRRTGGGGLLAMLAVALVARRRRL
jgi:subtilisin family serine protease